VLLLITEEGGDASADDDDIDSSTGNCLASASQLIHLPDTRLLFRKYRDVNAHRPAKVAYTLLYCAHQLGLVYA